MKIGFYLLISASGGIELRKTLPRRQQIDRIVVPMSVTISDAWFRQQLIPTIAVDIPDAAVLPAPIVEPIEEELGE